MSTRYGFGGGGDSASVVLSGAGGFGAVVMSLPGGVVLTISAVGAQQWSYRSIHGDVLVTAGADGKKGAGPIYRYDPFGQPLNPSTGAYESDAVPASLAGALDNAWLGQHQRPYEHTGSIATVEMGLRNYGRAQAWRVQQLLGARGSGWSARRRKEAGRIALAAVIVIVSVIQMCIWMFGPREVSRTGAAATLVDGQPAVTFAMCPGDEVKSVRVTSQLMLIWGASTDTGVAASPPYVLGRDNPGMTSDGVWAAPYPEHSVHIDIQLADGVILGVDANYGLRVTDDGLYGNAGPITEAQLAEMRPCAT